LDAQLAALRNQSSNLRPCDFGDADVDTWIGTVAGVDEIVLPAALSAYECRNIRLAYLGLQMDGFEQAVHSAIRQYGAHRVGVFMGTSNAGILETELGYRQRDPVTGALPAGVNYEARHSTYSLVSFVRRYFQLSGISVVISTACSSSAKTFAAAARMISLGQIDAAIVGGVDSLCYTTLYGFSSLELTSRQACRPYDANRSGLSLGEGAAFALLQRPAAELDTQSDTAPDPAAIYLLGYGETSDAHHMSSPHPQGLGARMAMEQALTSAGLQTTDIDYINLHGTATLSNDLAEGRAVLELFGADTACSSTKGHTGHTLGAAGAVEAIVCALSLKHGIKPGGTNTQELDAAIGINYLLKNEYAAATAPLRYALSNSFGFGGSNCALVFGVAP
jgi:3-oxoacyl-[acyl-carrier-protein] synthase-1